MKILCINSNGLNNDGITNSIIDYFQNMDLDNMQVHILKTKETNLTIIEKIQRIGLEIKFTDNRKNIFSYLIKTAKLIKQEKYDIVHVHGSSALLSLDLLAAKIGGCKIRIAHSRNTTCTHKKTDKLLRPFFYKLCNVRFACGEDAGKWLFGDRSFITIKNGKDLAKFSFDQNIREKVRKKYAWDDKIIIGHVGNFNYQKNHSFLLDIFSELYKSNPKYFLVMVGSGTDYFIQMKSKVKALQLDDHVLFTGSISNVDELLQGMDIMMLPSHFEGFPNVVLEWQAEGLPCFVSDKVTGECALTDLVRFLPIDKGIDYWVNAINSIKKVNRKDESENSIQILTKQGYDIKEAAQRLQDIYCQLVREYSK